MTPWDPKLAELASTVFAMAENLDLTAPNGKLPFTGDELREHYRALVRSYGAEHALRDAQHRYDRQVLCELLALDGSGTVVHRELPSATP